MTTENPEDPTNAESAETPAHPEGVHAPQGAAPIARIRNPWVVILLSIITIGIYFLYWQYASFASMKRYSGVGIGGGIALVLAIFIGIVNAFVFPSEISGLYRRDGATPPVTTVTGFWVLLPLVGFVVWTYKTQVALNEFWSSHGIA